MQPYELEPASQTQLITITAEGDPINMCIIIQAVQYTKNK